MSIYNPVKYIQFGCFTPAEWLRISVAEITEPSSQGDNVKDYTNTPYDKRLGVFEEKDRCLTCINNNQDCDGHFGHITLPIPLYNIECLDMACNINKVVCTKCARPRILPDHLYLLGLDNLEKEAKFKAILKRCSKITLCPWEDCGATLPTFSIVKENGHLEIMMTYNDMSPVPFSAAESLNVFMRITNEHLRILGFNRGLSDNIDNSDIPIIYDDLEHIHQYRPEATLFVYLPVTPPCSRPPVNNGEQKCDDDLTDKYNTIIKVCKRLAMAQKGDTTKIPTKSRGRKNKSQETDIAEHTRELQNHVNSLISNKEDDTKASTGNRPFKSLCARETSKEGRLQKNIAGKRVDFSARSVIIAGGPFIAFDQLGVPEHIAKNLTTEQAVVELNFEYLQDLVKKGFVNYIRRDGNIRRLDHLPDKGASFRLRLGDKAAVQLLNDTVVVFNRQPSLRKESVQAFRLLRIPHAAFRLPTFVASAFNADFDGDEMNMHVFQNEEAQAEARYLMMSPYHIATEQRNSLVNGAIQDGLVGPYICTNHWNDGTLTMVPLDIVMNVYVQTDISQERINDMLIRAYKYYKEYIICTKNAKTSQLRYSFRRSTKGDSDNLIPGSLFMSILMPRTFCYKKKTEVNSSYPYVEIAAGIILPNSGPLDKNTIGAKAGSIVHRLYKDYSCKTAANFLTEVERLTDYWFRTEGFSFSISDCINDNYDEVNKLIFETQTKVDKILENSKQKIISNGGKTDIYIERDILTVLNSTMNKASLFSKKNMAKGDKNALNRMKESGAKGSNINGMQIAIMLGQQAINGQRIAFSIADKTKTLPHYDENDNGMESRGFVSSSYLRGLNVKESFHHSAGGRTGVVSTAVTTSESGYIQKKIDKKIGDLYVEMDGTVRDSNGRIILYLYGDDGFNAKRLIWIPDVEFPFFCNPQEMAEELNCEAELDGTVSKGTEKIKFDDDLLELLFEHIHIGITKMSPDNPIIRNQMQIMTNVLKVLLNRVEIYQCMLPRLILKIRDEFDATKAQYGETVGQVATNSIGEPTTQMVLNVFHLAGVASKDVSLGLPRFNELLNVTKPEKQKKKSSRVYVNIPKVNDLREILKNNDSKGTATEIFEILQGLSKDIEETFISDVLENDQIKYVPVYDDNGVEIDVSKRVSPVNILTYEEYQEEWWVELAKDLGKCERADNESKVYTCDATDGIIKRLQHFEKHASSEITPSHWVINLQFNVDKLYEKNLDLDSISKAIEETFDNNVLCVASPDILGRIEVYINFDIVDANTKGKFESVLSENGETKRLVTKNNINFFITRDVILKAIKMVKVCGIKGIKKIFPQQDTKSNEWYLDTQGSNLSKLFALPYVDCERTVSDDVWEIYNMFGIEAAVNFLIEEFDRVISFDGTYVNKRHSQLLINMMTVSGTITSVHRCGISKDAEPISQILFEKSIEHAFNSSTYTRQDNMNSIASSIMFGGVAKVGTGKVDIKNSETLPVRPIKI